MPPANISAVAAKSPADAKYATLIKHLDLFGDVLERVRNEYVDEPDDGALIETALQGMLQRLDPLSEFYNP